MPKDKKTKVYFPLNNGVLVESWEKKKKGKPCQPKSIVEKKPDREKTVGKKGTGTFLRKAKKEKGSQKGGRMHDPKKKKTGLPQVDPKEGQATSGGQEGGSGLIGEEDLFSWTPVRERRGGGEPGFVASANCENKQIAGAKKSKNSGE